MAAIVLASYLIISGCAGSGRAYEGTAKAPETIAVIKGSGSAVTERVLIDVVDGKMFSPSLTEVEVLPGRRMMTVRYVDMVHCIPLIECLTPTTYLYSTNVEVDAEAGHTYQFQGEGSWANQPDPINLRLLDMDTNEAVWQTKIDSSRPTYILK